MALDPVNVDPSPGVTLGIYSGLSPNIIRPKPVNCLGGTKPTLPAFSAPSSTYTDTRLAQSYASLGATSGAVCMLGDSLTQYMDVSAISPFAVNLGIGSDTTAGLLNRVEQLTPWLSVAGATVLMIGVNDSISFPANSQTIGRLTNLLNWITGPMVFSKIVHINVDTYMPSNPSKASLNPNINTINSAMDSVVASRIAAGRPTAVVDINPQVSAVDGQLLPSMHSGDGVHWSPLCKNIWRNAVSDSLRTLQ